jgi:hypothetical protein
MISINLLRCPGDNPYTGYCIERVSPHGSDYYRSDLGENSYNGVYGYPSFNSFNVLNIFPFLVQEEERYDKEIIDRKEAAKSFYINGSKQHSYERAGFSGTINYGSDSLPHYSTQSGYLSYRESSVYVGEGRLSTVFLLPFETLSTGYFPDTDDFSDHVFWSDVLTKDVDYVKIGKKTSVYSPGCSINVKLATFFEKVDATSFRLYHQVVLTGDFNLPNGDFGREAIEFFETWASPRMSDIIEGSIVSASSLKRLYCNSWSYTLDDLLKTLDQEFENMYFEFKYLRPLSAPSELKMECINSLKALNSNELENVVQGLSDARDLGSFLKNPTTSVNHIRQRAEKILQKLKKTLPSAKKLTPKSLKALTGLVYGVNAAASGWLSYKYSYCCTKSDVEEISNRLKEIGFALEGSTRSLYLQRPKATSKYENTRGNEYRVNAELFVRPPERGKVLSLNERLDSLGLNLSLQHAWDFVPFSFVVDWFWQVGSALEMRDLELGLTGSAFDILFESISYKVEWHSSTFADVTFSAYERVVSPFTLEPVLVPGKGLAGDRKITSTALLTQVLISR